MTRRFARQAAVLLAVAALLGGCRLRADAEVTVDGDGAGRLAYTVAVDRALRESVATAGADPLEAVATTVERLPGWKVSRSTADPFEVPPAGGGVPSAPASVDGPTEPTVVAGDSPTQDAAPPLTAVTLSTTFADGVELERISGEFAEALAAPELRPLEALRVEVDDSTVTLRGGASLDVGQAVAELGLDRRRAGRVLDESVTMQVVAEMPGDIIETNADERDGATVTWIVTAGQRRQLLVVARRPWTVARLAALLVTLPGMLALAAGAFIVGGWWLVRRRRT